MILNFFRGDDRPPNNKTLIRGFASRYKIMSPGQARLWLAEKLTELGAVQDLGFWLRLETREGVVATALVSTGAYEGKEYFYWIKIPNVSLVKLTSQGAGEPIKTYADALKSKYFLILDKANYEMATMIAVGQAQVGTKEASFLTPIPRKYIVAYKKKSGSKWFKMPAAAARSV